VAKAVWDLKKEGTVPQDKNVFDCFVAESLLNLGQVLSHTDLDDTLKKYKVSTLSDLAKAQKEELIKTGELWDLFSNIEMPLMFVLSAMEKKGIILEKKRLSQIGLELTQTIQKLEKEMLSEVGFDINLNSSTQIGNYLAEKQAVPLGRTKTGKYATNESELNKFSEHFPFIKKLLSLRELSKLKSTYVEGLIDKVAPDGRIHTTYHQTGIATGRLASSNPNLQNIPDNSAYGNKIKCCFVSQKDKMLVSFDYSQQELRILAHMANEEKLIDAFSKKFEEKI
jgi:DNA polymerase-1